MNLTDAPNSNGAVSAAGPHYPNSSAMQFSLFEALTTTNPHAAAAAASPSTAKPTPPPPPTGSKPTNPSAPSPPPAQGKPPGTPIKSPAVSQPPPPSQKAAVGGETAKKKEAMCHRKGGSGGSGASSSAGAGANENVPSAFFIPLDICFLILFLLIGVICVSLYYALHIVTFFMSIIFIGFSLFFYHLHKF